MQSGFQEINISLHLHCTAYSIFERPAYVAQIFTFSASKILGGGGGGWQANLNETINVLKKNLVMFLFSE